MRCTQLYGLHEKAQEFLRENAMLEDQCECCKRHSGYVQKEIAKIGMFDDASLHEYPLKNGHVAREFVQNEVWSSGPMIWLGLEIGDEKIVWPEDEMEEG